MTKFIAFIMVMIVAGAAVWKITGALQAESPRDLPKRLVDPCQPLPEYLSKLKILPPSLPPVDAPIIIEFAASGSEPKGKIAEYLWRYEGQSRRGKRVRFTLKKRGTAMINLQAKDISGCTQLLVRRVPVK